MAQAISRFVVLALVACVVSAAVAPPAFVSSPPLGQVAPSATSRVRMSAVKNRSSGKIPAPSDKVESAPLGRVDLPDTLLEFLGFAINGDRQHHIPGRFPRGGRSGQETSNGHILWPMLYELIRQTDWRVKAWCVDGPDEKHDNCFLYIIQKDGTGKLPTTGDGTQFALMVGENTSDKALDDLKWLMRKEGIMQCMYAARGHIWIPMYLDSETDQLMPIRYEGIALTANEGEGPQAIINYIVDRLNCPNKKEDDGYPGLFNETPELHKAMERPLPPIRLSV
ncbi:unnamed protein product [Vitrella brassicaformis CCMP3155]|uniref:Uncharacterized protein n=1 Tax=Vitrella brassicaformis (strain CCMP3155) TaxID=1169540 RepID=A0A0G4FTF9_VITBC|nr:unnamed protein product [Vitrella brassicaformis CCMP3155]|eukprot:CEM18146.1 unnamed protein product [Vitrella brassicaformis CCMP3155]